MIRTDVYDDHESLHDCGICGVPGNASIIVLMSDVRDFCHVHEEGKNMIR